MAGDPRPGGRLYYGYWLIVASFVAQFVAVGVTNYAAGPFLTPMTEELGWTRAEFTIPRSLGGFVMAITGFLIGSWVDRFGARPFMGVSFAGIGVTPVLVWVFDAWGWRFAWEALAAAALFLGPLRWPTSSPPDSSWPFARRARAARPQWR